MYIRQISVFLENTTGSLHSMTRLLGEHGVDLIALSIADSDSFGVLRCVAHSGAAGGGIHRPGFGRDLRVRARPARRAFPGAGAAGSGRNFH